MSSSPWVIDAAADPHTDILAAYERGQLLLIRNAAALGKASPASSSAAASSAASASASASGFGFPLLCGINDRAPDMVRQTWNIERRVRGGPRIDEPDDVLGRAPGGGGDESCSIPGGQWYASFVCQHDEKELSRLVDAMPVPSPFAAAAAALASRSATATAAAATAPPPVVPPPVARFSKAVWLFFGANSSATEALDGRPEHTDCVDHSGTFHYQARGAKTWHVRPDPSAHGGTRCAAGHGSRPHSPPSWILARTLERTLGGTQGGAARRVGV